MPESDQAGRLDTLSTLIAAVLTGLLVWERLDPDGPRTMWARMRERAREWREYQESIRRTLGEIESLPETERRP